MNKNMVRDQRKYFPYVGLHEELKPIKSSKFKILSAKFKFKILFLMPKTSLLKLKIMSKIS